MIRTGHIRSFGHIATPLHRVDTLSEELGIDLWMKRDDLFAFPGGGNKARKAQYIFATAEAKGHDAVVTTGSAHSNHIRVCALMCAKLGWHCRVLVHDDRPKHHAPNLFMASLAGSEIIFVEQHGISEAMDDAMEEMRGRGLHPLYIWGGGHCLEGSYAYQQAVHEFAQQAAGSDLEPSSVIFASGTGTTHAGLHAGFAELFPNTKVIGVSVARDHDRGVNVIRSSLLELLDMHNDQLIDKVHFDTRALYGGYGKFDGELLALVSGVLRTSGIPLDPIYTGKAYSALHSMVKAGEVQQGERVLFWHTGGLNNLLSFQELYPLA